MPSYTYVGPDLSFRIRLRMTKLQSDMGEEFIEDGVYLPITDQIDVNLVDRILDTLYVTFENVGNQLKKEI